MNILITGAGGFLGRNIVAHFSQKGWQVRGLVRKTDGLMPMPGVLWFALELPSPALGVLLAREQPDVIVHAAASANVGLSVSNPAQDFAQSVVTFSNLLDSVRLSGISPQIIFLSSAAVYGNPATLPVREDAPIAPVSPYGFHKRMCEEMASYYQNLYGLEVSVLRIFSAYGDGLRRQVLWDMVQQARATGRIALSGTGDESRDFIHASDVARGIECVAASAGRAPTGVLNVASGVSTTIRSLATLVQDAICGPGQPVIPVAFSGQQRSGDPLRWQADITRLAALGFTPGVSLEEGVRRYVSWVQNLQ